MAFLFVGKRGGKVGHASFVRDGRRSSHDARITFVSQRLRWINLFQRTSAASRTPCWGH
jgi:hypothetical protein